MSSYDAFLAAEAERHMSSDDPDDAPLLSRFGYLRKVVESRTRGMEFWKATERAMLRGDIKQVDHYGRLALTEAKIGAGYVQLAGGGL